MGKAEADSGDKGLIWEIELSIPIESFGALYNNRAGSRADRDAAVSEVRARRLEVEGQLRGLYMGIALGQRRLELQRRSEQQLARLIAVARQRVTQGEARPMEVTRLEIEQYRAQADMNALQSALDARRQTLNLWLGGTLPPDYAVEADTDALPPLPDPDEARRLALKHSPLLQAATARIAAGASRLKAQQYLLVPTMSLGAFYEQELEGRNIGGTLSIVLPLWNFNDGGIAKARAQRAAAQFDRDVQQRSLLARVLEIRSAAGQAYQRVEQYRDAIIPRARNSAESLEKMYAVGEIGLMDMLDARRSLTDTEAQLLEALDQSWRLYLDLITTMGGIHE